MILTEELIAFIRDHRNDNLDRLLLSASKYPGIDMGFVVDQIIAREKIREKLPSWGAIEVRNCLRGALSSDCIFHQDWRLSNAPPSGQRPISEGWSRQPMSSAI